MRTLMEEDGHKESVMPRLPSGQQVSLDISTISAIVSRKWLPEERETFFNFKRVSDIYPLIQVHLLVEQTSMSEPLVAYHMVPCSRLMSATLVHKDRGGPLSELEENIQAWPQGDSMKMRQFIRSVRTQALFLNIYKCVKEWEGAVESLTHQADTDKDDASPTWTL